ncbi:MAG: methyltransferase domain-containing protein [Vulcanimicrobiota bacterium]
MKKDIRYVPTPPAVVEAMLDLASVGPRDVFYDLGSGDGRLVIGAALRGAQAVGIDIDKSLVLRSRVLAVSAGVDELASFRHQNFFEADFQPATVVSLYLLHSVNLALLPKLQAELKPGTRLISHSFDMGLWKPQRELMVETKLLFLWTV